MAQRFHEAYERLAPSFGYETRRASAVPWTDVPEQNKALMTAVCADILATNRRPVHEYLSTACWHGDHNYCKSMSGYQGKKRPGQCKFCHAKCSCSCHKTGVSNS
jgi:hypothetical protein